MRVQASARDKVRQALNHQELESIFKEADNVREAVLRGGRAPGSNMELFEIVRDAVNQVS